MARMNSKSRSEFDGNPALILRNATAGAITVTTAEAPIVIDTLKRAYWDNGESTIGVATVIVEVPAIKTSALTELYDFFVEISTDAAFTTPIQLIRQNTAAAAPTTAKVGVYHFPISFSLIEKLLPGATHMRIRLSLGGTAPSITYGARLTFIKN